MYNMLVKITMADASSVEPQLNFEEMYNPKSTHGNWLERKFKDLAQGIEIRSKGETMGFDYWKFFEQTLFQAALATDARNFGLDPRQFAGTTISFVLIKQVISAIEGPLFYYTQKSIKSGPELSENLKKLQPPK